MDTNIKSRPYNMKMSPRKTECAVEYQYSASSNKFGRVEGPTHRVSAPAMPLGDEKFCRRVTFTSVRDLHLASPQASRSPPGLQGTFPCVNFTTGNQVLILLQGGLSTSLAATLQADSYYYTSRDHDTASFPSC